MSPIEYRQASTDKIIKALSDGTAPWVKPWDENRVSIGMPFNAITQRAYHGGNALYLQCQLYEDPRWCTYKQAQSEGWQVRKGEQASVVEYWQWEKEERDADGEISKTKLESPKVFYAKVFNAKQMDHLPELVLSKGPEWQPELAAERILKNANPHLLHDQINRAFYVPSKDEIHLPSKTAFPTASRYYATVLHELGHWSGHESRLNRDLSSQYGTESYAREELRAELASYFLSAKTGIPHDPAQHAAYIQSWINILQNDHNEIFRAAKEAEKMTEYVLQFEQENQLVTSQTEHAHKLTNKKYINLKQVEEEALEC